MRFSLALTATLLLVGAGCNNVVTPKTEDSENKPMIQENETMVTTETEIQDESKANEMKIEVKSDDQKKEVERKEMEDDDDSDDKKTVTTQPTVKPADTKPVETATPVTTGPKTYTMAEVQAAAAAGKCWTIISGKVYDLSSWITKHPGGEAAIRSLCGIDGTAKFTAMHGGAAKPEAVLASYQIGVAK